MANRIIAGRYELLKPVGRGGMSTVYLASDLNLHKNWAVKEIRKKKTVGGIEVENSLLAEAEMMKTLDHPSLPKIVDIIDERDFFYIVMDYVEGETLRDVIDRYGPQDQNQVIKWGKELTLVLGYLHSQDPPIIYRDLKPGNIILQPNGSLKIIDFGTAREFKHGKSKDTAPLGTKGYAAPEQYDTGDGESAQTDERTDIYTLGMTMYELLTCKLPNKAPYKLIPLRQVRPELSIGLERIIQRCTKSDPSERFQNTTELMTALLNYKKLDYEYVSDQKKKLLKAILPVGIGILMLFAGAGSLVANKVMVNNQYENLIAETSDHDAQIKNLKKAIEIKPDDPAAYQLLIKEYAKSNEGYTERNMQEAMSICSEGLKNIDPDSEAYLDINYMLGEAHLVYFSGETDKSLRNKILNSEPYFKAVVNTKKTEYENYNLCNAYVKLASFYENYVLGTSEGFVFDAGKEEYQSAVKDFDSIITILNGSSSSGSSQLKIASYNIILNIIDSEKTNFSANVSYKSIKDIFARIKEDTTQITTSNERLNEEKEELLKYEQYVEANYDKAAQEAKKRGEM